MEWGGDKMGCMSIAQWNVRKSAIQFGGDISKPSVKQAA
jgi:hypothetical protein